MNGQTVALTTATAAVGVTIVSLMVPNAIDARPVNDVVVQRAHMAALASTAILGIMVSILDGTPFPFIGGMLTTGMVVVTHNAVQANGMGELVS